MPQYDRKGDEKPKLQTQIQVETYHIMRVAKEKSMR